MLRRRSRLAIFTSVIGASLALGMAGPATAAAPDSAVLESGLTAKQAYDSSLKALEASRVELARARTATGSKDALRVDSSSAAAASADVSFPSYFSSSGLEKVSCVLVIANASACDTARNNAQAALNLAAARYPSSVHNGRGDAFRHCYWNGLMTVSIGVSSAERIAGNHEAVSSNPQSEKTMDLYNNSRGRWVGTTYGTGYAADVRCTELLGKSKVLGGLQTAL